MPNEKINELLNLSISIITKIGNELTYYESQSKEYTFSIDHPREIKAVVDNTVEKKIIDLLAPTGISILSEESGFIQGVSSSKLYFIIDPIDGTYNYVKDLGPCAISIALWDDEFPVFGVIFNIRENKVAWGGKEIVSKYGGRRIEVSKIKDKSKASICTGFPSRYNLDRESVMLEFWNLVSKFSKVRMIGSAAISLLNLSKGSCDVYSEKGIMIWDVAAGLAILEGSGGEANYEKSNIKHSLNVYASNKFLSKSGL